MYGITQHIFFPSYCEFQFHRDSDLHDRLSFQHAKKTGLSVSYSFMHHKSSLSLKFRITNPDPDIFAMHMLELLTISAEEFDRLGESIDIDPDQEPLFLVDKVMRGVSDSGELEIVQQLREVAEDLEKMKNFFQYHLGYSADPDHAHWPTASSNQARKRAKDLKDRRSTLSARTATANQTFGGADGLLSSDENSFGGGTASSSHNFKNPPVFTLDDLVHHTQKGLEKVFSWLLFFAHYLFVSFGLLVFFNVFFVWLVMWLIVWGNVRLTVDGQSVLGERWMERRQNDLKFFQGFFQLAM